MIAILCLLSFCVGYDWLIGVLFVAAVGVLFVAVMKVAGMAGTLLRRIVWSSRRMQSSLQFFPSIMHSVQSSRPDLLRTPLSHSTCNSLQAAQGMSASLRLLGSYRGGTASSSCATFGSLGFESQISPRRLHSVQTFVVDRSQVRPDSVHCWHYMMSAFTIYKLIEPPRVAWRHRKKPFRMLSSS